VLTGAVAVFLAGWWATGRYIRDDGDDPKEVVIDEVAGQLLCLSVVAPGWLAYAAGFALFRLFDIVKPWPVGWCDRTVKGALGVMLDDVLAAVYAAAVLLLAQYFGIIP
jgi:phosphatidylglycerophosphatase A